jgi:ferric-dicitrate binding protein FerR (iron transport regulator)
MTPDAPTDDILFRFIAELCSASERGTVESWLRADPANGRRLDDVRRIWAASRPAVTRDVDRMWTRLRAGVESAASSPGKSGNGHTAERTLPRIVRLSARTLPAATWAAAVVVFAAGAAIVASLSRSESPVHAAAAAHTYATGIAQTANVRLRDGTRVFLAPQSRLTVPDDFGGGTERLVELDGQAFFDVVHNAAHPFGARAKGAVAQDIGTRFDMRAYDDEPGVAVIVASGAVTLGHVASDSGSRGAEGVVLRRGERGRTDGPGGATTVDRVPLSLVDWTEGRLSFAKTPLAEVARTIGRWYGLDVRVPDAALRARLITADFDTQSPKEMVGALATAVGGTVVQEGRTLTIRRAR